MKLIIWWSKIVLLVIANLHRVLPSVIGWGITALANGLEWVSDKLHDLSFYVVDKSQKFPIVGEKHLLNLVKERGATLK